MEEIVRMELRRMITPLTLRARDVGRPAILSMMIMVFCAVAFAIACPRQFEQAAEIPSVDSVHIAASALGVGIAPTHAITLIKVDDRTHATWGRPFPVAKARLVELLELLRGLGPTAILVDFDFSTERDPADTARFSALLSSWSGEDPPLLLPAELTVQPDGSVARKDSTIDVPESAAKVFWTSVLFRKDRDHKVREWRLWEHSCESGELLLSPQLLIAALLEGGVSEVVRVKSALRKQAACLDTDSAQSELPSWLVDASLTAPINYVFARTGQPYVDAFGTSMLTEWSAADVLSKGIAPSAVASRTVIIGASHAERGDNHATPIGQMEGMRVLANAIATGPDVFGMRTITTIEAVLLWLLFSASGIALLKRLKVAFAGIAILTIAVLFYAVIARIYGPANAISVLSWGTTLVGAFFVLESLIQFLFELIHERRGWRALLARE